MNFIFTYGSNLAGKHGAGAALHAKKYHGAVYGYGHGRKGNSYGIPTKDVNIKTLPIKKVQEHVKRFLAYATHRPELDFMVTAIGCGLAGFTHADIAPLFKDAPSNCWFDDLWQPFLGPEKKYWGTYDVATSDYVYSEAYKAHAIA